MQNYGIISQEQERYPALVDWNLFWEKLSVHEVLATGECR